MEGDKAKGFRPASPVKMLSSFLSGGFNSSTTSFKDSASSYTTPTRQPRTPGLGNIPSMGPQLTRSNSNKSTHSVSEFMEGKGSLRGNSDDSRPVNPLVRLEETFTGYIGALQSRKGNIVGKVLRNRANADELTINAIYNTFIENPFDQRAASEVSVDIIFVAFEKYLRMAWRDQMGQVMSSRTLDGLQDRANKLFPGDFADYVRMVFGEMAPQNRRAFISIIKLLADLLEGCGNDGDRGALTAAFAELLVTDGNPHDYINLLDRMVGESERLFEDIGPGAISGTNSNFGSISGARSIHSANASITSNTSSLRRRFADTILRQNSTKEDRPSVWRTLSKTSRSVATGEAIPSTISKGSSINRSRSIESPGRRPMSRDRPSVLGAFEERPSSSQGQPSRLSTIGASPPPEEKKDIVKSGKKSRRSSLSDLKSLMAAATLGESSPISPSPNRNKLTKLNLSPRTPSPTKIPVVNGDRGRSAAFLTGSPKQKENTPTGIATRNIGNLTERPGNIMSTPDSPVNKDLWSAGKGHSKTVSLSSNIPTLRGNPRDSISSSPRPTTSAGKTSPQKLRLQSTQKLRERIHNEKTAISEAETSLQNELSKIGEEMARVNAGSSIRPQDLEKLSSTVQKMEAKIPELVKDFTARNESIKADMEKSLQASEYKVKAIDQLYKESSAENELLYEKFNGELGKIVKALKGKGKEDKEFLVAKAKEQGEEAAKIKKENAKLKREILTLRALLKGNE